MDYKPHELCKIIKACRASGVTNFSYQGIELKFDSDPVVEIIPTVSQNVIDPTVQKELVLEQELAENQIEEYELENLAISDPLEYERLITQG